MENFNHKTIKTVKKMARTLLYIKKSKFIATIAPVDTGHDAEAFINQVRCEFADATHNVPAWIIHGNVPIERCSDDGEPSGTAGKPLLQMLNKEGLSNIAVVVTRYFGGILLGTGGLVKAYTEAGKMAVNEAGIVELRPYLQIRYKTDYNKQREFKYLVDSCGGIVVNTTYGEKVIYEILIPENKYRSFVDVLSERSFNSNLEYCVVYR